MFCQGHYKGGLVVELVMNHREKVILFSEANGDRVQEIILLIFVEFPAQNTDDTGNHTLNERLLEEELLFDHVLESVVEIVCQNSKVFDRAKEVVVSDLDLLNLQVSYFRILLYLFESLEYLQLSFLTVESDRLFEIFFLRGSVDHYYQISEAILDIANCL